MMETYENFHIEEFVQSYKRAKEKVDTLRRCTKCVLPETFPFISFDEDGVCNYCHHYIPMAPQGTEALEKALRPYQEADGSTKCIVSFSGGRDSSYGLHYVKKVLGLDPIAFTYDWGVASEIAFRNQKRMCEKLGVEQILIKANLDKKRAHIRANLQAWLKQPDLGMIPVLTSVGQQFFYYANQVRKRLGRELIVICATPLESTYFKTGFNGVEPYTHGNEKSAKNKLKLTLGYFGNYLKNPAYLNSSLLDSLGGFFSFYIVPHNYVRLYDYIRWDEKMVNDTLINQYDWEISDETPSTWRIDDGTVPLSDYMYYMMSGLTISDTMRSNQIREGDLTREEALEIVQRENQPRFNAIQWYCETIGVDFESTIRTINQAPRLYH